LFLYRVVAKGERRLHNHPIPAKSDTLKRLTKLALSMGFFSVVSAGQFLKRLLGLKNRATCVILDYHAVSGEGRADFAKQMDLLTRLAKPIPADCSDSLEDGRHYVGVTFDDGLHCVIENAVPELIQRRIPATMFIVHDLLGNLPNWTMFGEDYSDQEPIASLADLQNLPADLFTIGSHSLSHAWLPALTDSKAREELVGSRTKLEELTGRKVRLFSFPYGASNERLVGQCREAGYDRVFTILPTLGLDRSDEFVTGRVVVDPTDWPLEFRFKILGAYRWLPWAFRWKRRFFRAQLANPVHRSAETSDVSDNAV
jgi:peptidoglycan/xylan/chitin deacetylase (PgdA/CDA1 family)